MNDPKYLVCKHCGNLVAVIKDSGVPMICCGEEMKELVAGTTDASLEKHVPVITVDGKNITVAVGSVAHPMLPEHYIEWIALVTEKGYQFKSLKPGDEPVADFVLVDGDKVVAAYEYCNLHKLWKKEA